MAEARVPAVYIVKWIPKDQDAVIDHSTHYGTLLEAMQFAINALRLNPKRIWIENREGEIHAAHDDVLKQRRGSAREQQAAIFPNFAKDATGCPLACQSNEGPSKQVCEDRVRTVIEEIRSLLNEEFATQLSWDAPVCARSDNGELRTAILHSESRSTIRRERNHTEMNDPAVLHEIEILLGISAVQPCS